MSQLRPHPSVFPTLALMPRLSVQWCPHQLPRLKQRISHSDHRLRPRGSHLHPQKTRRSIVKESQNHKGHLVIDCLGGKVSRLMSKDRMSRRDRRKKQIRTVIRTWQLPGLP